MATISSPTQFDNANSKKISLPTKVEIGRNEGAHFVSKHGIMAMDLFPPRLSFHTPQNDGSQMSIKAVALLCCCGYLFCLVAFFVPQLDCGIIAIV
jgi:hypothetical protein